MLLLHQFNVLRRCGPSKPKSVVEAQACLYNQATKQWSRLRRFRFEMARMTASHQLEYVDSSAYWGAERGDYA